MDSDGRSSEKESDFDVADHYLWAWTVLNEKTLRHNYSLIFSSWDSLSMVKEAHVMAMIKHKVIVVELQDQAVKIQSSHDKTSSCFWEYVASEEESFWPQLYEGLFDVEMKGGAWGVFWAWGEVKWGPREDLCHFTEKPGCVPYLWGLSKISLSEVYHNIWGL